ncbi:splicing factor 3B subunit 1 [Tanacetum coccineum]
MLRQLTDKAREFSVGPLFNLIYKLDELVRPYVHKILVVIEPLLIDEDYYARVEGREIISKLSKAAGLATMIAGMCPDIDNIDEYVRNITARAFSFVASAHGIRPLLPFLKPVCQSKKSWQARHTGIKIVQQIAILIGCAVLPHLRSLVEIIEYGLNDKNQKVLKHLWKGIRSHRSKVLAAFLKAIGFIIHLMDVIYASYCTKEVMVILIHEIHSPDEEMKKIMLKVVKQCVSTEGVKADYIRTDILPEFFRNFWVRMMALDRRNYKQLVETIVEIANKVGVPDIVARVVEDLKDESKPYRRMVMETIERVVANLGTSDIDPRLEELLIDGILYAFQEQTSDDASVMLNGFGAVVNSLGQRVKPYLPQIYGTIKWRLNNKSANVRQQAEDLISRIAVVLKQIDIGVSSCKGVDEDLFELLEMLKAHKKGIRRATVNTFGYITKAIGPQDVRATLLNNLKVQERQNRV